MKQLTVKRVQYTTRHGSLKVVVDSDEVFPSDPGMGTPIVVYATNDEGREVSATIQCALGEGEVEGTELTGEEIGWLYRMQKLAETRLRPFWN